MPTRRKAAPRGRAAGPAAVIRVTEATGESPRSWDAAVAAAAKAAAVKEPVGVEIVRLWADWNGQRLSRYRAAVKVAYRQRLKSPSR